MTGWAFEAEFAELAVRLAMLMPTSRDARWLGPFFYGTLAVQG